MQEGPLPPAVCPRRGPEQPWVCWGAKCPLLSPQVSCPQTSTTARWITLLTPMPWPSAGNVWNHTWEHGLALCSSTWHSAGMGAGGLPSGSFFPPLTPLCSQRKSGGSSDLFSAHVGLKGISIHSRASPVAFHGVSVLLASWRHPQPGKGAPGSVMEAVTPGSISAPCSPTAAFTCSSFCPLSPLTITHP